MYFLSINRARNEMFRGYVRVWSILPPRFISFLIKRTALGGRVRVIRIPLRPKEWNESSLLSRPVVTFNNYYCATSALHAVNDKRIAV